MKVATNKTEAELSGMLPDLPAWRYLGQSIFLGVIIHTVLLTDVSHQKEDTAHESLEDASSNICITPAVL